MTPGAYRKGGQGMRIAYTIVPSPLGRLLVAATERGISAVCLGDADGPLEAALRQEYAAAELRRDDTGLKAWVGGILQRMEGREPASALPVDLRATAFQRRVWEELKAIPRGQTRSYGEIARRIGSRPAARGGAGLRHEPGRAGHPVPPGGGRQRSRRRLSLGRRAQAAPAGARGGAHHGWIRGPPSSAIAEEQLAHHGAHEGHRPAPGHQLSKQEAAVLGGCRGGTQGPQRREGRHVRRWAPTLIRRSSTGSRPGVFQARIVGRNVGSTTPDGCCMVR